MHQIKQVIELLTKGYSIRSIARMSGIARNTISAYKLQFDSCEHSFQQLLLLDDQSLANLLYKKNDESPTASERLNDFKNRIAYFSSELRRRGVTRQLLWDEYRNDVSS
jgi:hypothetical protein